MIPEPRALPVPLKGASQVAERPALRLIWRRPLPLLEDPVTRFMVRALTAGSKRRVVEIRGLEHVAPESDPFIFVCNHNQRLEAVMLPALLIYHRDGKLIHFMADWQTMLVPLAGTLLRRGQVITVTRKSARWRVLNRLKPLFKHPEPAFERAFLKLRSGSSVGIFPESTMNRDPRRLLRGQSGAARLALRSGVPIVPAGVSFPGHDPELPIGDLSPMAIEIGPPVQPPATVLEGKPNKTEIQDFHARTMREIARLSGKQWNPRAKRRRKPCP